MVWSVLQRRTIIKKMLDMPIGGYFFKDGYRIEKIDREQWKLDKAQSSSSAPFREHLGSYVAPQLIVGLIVGRQAQEENERRKNAKKGTLGLKKQKTKGPPFAG